MEEGIELSFKDFLAAIQTARLYGAGHALLQKAIDKAFNSITATLQARKKFTIGIVGDEIAFDKEILFSLSELSQAAVAYIKERGIEKITFTLGLEYSELEKMIFLLSRPKDEIKDNSLQGQLILMGVRNIIAGKLGVDSGPKAQKTHSFEGVSSSLADILDRKAVDGVSLRKDLNKIIDNLGAQYYNLSELNTLKRYDSDTFSHQVDTAILSMYFSSKIGFPRETVSDIGLAALFHDIGKLYISRKIINKPGSLSESEFSDMTSHTLLGAVLALEHVDTLGIMPVVVSFEHHLKYDLSGYPKLTFPKKQHIVSQIVSICDVYSALSERRKYKAGYSPEEIYSLMMRGKGTAYNPSLLDKFFKLFGVWPIGSIVRLSDKRVAVVSEENQDDIFSPLVRVIYPLKEEVLTDLKNNKSGLKIERYLNPWSEGKEFLAYLQT